MWKSKRYYLSVLLLLLGMVLLSGCIGKKPSFAIYLLSSEMTAAEAQEIPLEELPLKEHPFLWMEDVVTYDPGSYELTLTKAGAEVVRRQAIPVRGLPFVVVARGERIYSGAFWTPVSSQSFEGISAMMSLEEGSTALRFDLGYPAVEFFEGEDLRNDERIIKAFTKAEKLAEEE